MGRERERRKLYTSSVLRRKEVRREGLNVCMLENDGEVGGEGVLSGGIGSECIERDFLVPRRNEKSVEKRHDESDYRTIC